MHRKLNSMLSDGFVEALLGLFRAAGEHHASSKINPYAQAMRAEQ